MGRPKPEGQGCLGAIVSMLCGTKTHRFPKGAKR